MSESVKGATEHDIVRLRLEVAEMTLRHIIDPFDVRTGDLSYVRWYAKMALHTPAQIEHTVEENRTRFATFASSFRDPVAQQVQQ
jgi:hypothetical protein